MEGSRTGVAAGINPYAYARNDPVNFADASGDSACVTTPIGTTCTPSSNEVDSHDPYVACGQYGYVEAAECYGLIASGNDPFGGTVQEHNIINSGQGDVGKAAERRCAYRAFVWAATSAADAIGVTEIARGALAVWKGISLARTNAALFARVGGYGRILAQNYADARASGVAGARAFALGAVVTDAPLAVAANGQSTTVGDVVKAFVPFSTFQQNEDKMVAACDPDRE